ncbi:MAG: ABC transporter ATP-binding protein [Oscillospiraceae bacterium]|nr:ABC transporter ATP-binding protein [Oscillospiraceae bacterium]
MGPGPGGMGRSGEKAKEFKKTWGKLIAYCKPQLPAVIVALICAAIGAALSLVGPNKISDITNLITNGFMTGIDIDGVVKICVTLVVIYALSATLSFSQGFIMATVTQRITKRLRSDVSQKINRLPIRYFNRTSTGDVLSRVTNDVDTIGQTMNQSIGTLVSAVTLLLGSLIMMLLTNVLMAVAAMGATVIGFTLMMVIMSKSQRYFSVQQENLGKMNGHVEEIYAGHNVVKVYNAQQAAKKGFDEINGKLCDSAFRSQFLSGLMMPIMMFIGNFGYVAVCVVGAVLAMNGSISFGVIVAFMLYVRLFTQPLSQLAQAATSMQSTAAAAERVFEFLGEEEMADESQKSAPLTDVKGEVEFRHVRFGYEDSDVTVIHDFSAKATPGQKIAIVGPTGAGKTTMVNLLMRFHEIQSGEILIDGTPISELTRENVHDLFCMVLQDSWLFEGTIRENIVYCKKNVTDAELENACQAAGIHHFIKTLPHGYDTVLNDESSLSAGQRQQITIARAMIQNAPMLILDEATSSVDTRTELQIQKAMDHLMESRTSFVIAHRLSTIKNADIILVMRDGDIIESGSHDELLAKSGYYAELYNSQFEQAS